MQRGKWRGRNSTDLGVVVWTGNRVPGDVGERVILLIEAGEGADMLDCHLGVHLDRAETLCTRMQ